MVEDKQILDSLERVGKIRAEIVKVAPKGRHTSGAIECPICKGRVRFARYSNGHVHAICSTTGCASWME